MATKPHCAASNAAPGLLLTPRSAARFADSSPLSWDQLCADHPQWEQYRDQAPSGWTFVTPEPHPVLQQAGGGGWHMLHPCQTQAAMALLLGGAEQDCDKQAAVHQPLGGAAGADRDTDLVPDLEDVDPAASNSVDVTAGRQSSATFEVAGENVAPGITAASGTSVTCMALGSTFHAAAAASVAAAASDAALIRYMCSWFSLVAPITCLHQRNELTQSLLQAAASTKLPSVGTPLPVALMSLTDHRH